MIISVTKLLILRITCHVQPQNTVHIRQKKVTTRYLTDGGIVWSIDQNIFQPSMPGMGRVTRVHCSAIQRMLVTLSLCLRWSRNTVFVTI